jgi:hypothetical protein
MLYMFLITYNPAHELPADAPSLQPQHAKLEQQLRDEGKYAGGAALFPPSFRPLLRVEGANVTRLDGPFAETKEVIGGFYVIDCKDEADAIARAQQIPVGPNAWIDVQQIALWRPK